MGSHRHRSQRFPFYSVLLYVGLVVALVAADRLARRSGVDPQRIVLAFLISIPAALAGARALEVALHWSNFRARPKEILRVRAGGAAMYGGLPIVVLLSFPLARWVGISLGLYWDIALSSIVAGMVPTRLGCFGAGCCAGRPTERLFGLRSRNARGVRARRHPLQLWEALLGAALFAASLALWEKLPFPGAVAFLITAGYGAGRFALEELREQRAPRFFGMSAYRWMSAGLFALGLAGLALGRGGLDAARALDPQLAVDGPGILHLIVAGLLLLPIVRLFRFLGCDLVFTATPDPDVVKHLLQMIVVVPDLGTGPVSARMQFLIEPDMSEIDESPVALDAAGTEPDGRLRFEKLSELTQGSYTVVCTVSRADAITRVGTCSGTLDAPALVVAFNAENGSAPNALQDRLCFETL